MLKSPLNNAYVMMIRTVSSIEPVQYTSCWHNDTGCVFHLHVIRNNYSTTLTFR